MAVTSVLFVATAGGCWRRPGAFPQCDSLDEIDLVGALWDGADGGYECLVRRYGGRMLATARRLLRQEADARDCVQDLQ